MKLGLCLVFLKTYLSNLDLNLASLDNAALVIFYLKIWFPIPTFKISIISFSNCSILSGSLSAVSTAHLRQVPHKHSLTEIGKWYISEKRHLGLLSSSRGASSRQSGVDAFLILL